MHGYNDHDFWRQRREDIVREVRENRLGREPRKKNRPARTLKWELSRLIELLGKRLRGIR